MAHLTNISDPFNRCLVENDKGEWFVYANALKGSIMIISKFQRTRYPNFKTFKLRHEGLTEEILKERWLELIKVAKDRVNLYDSESSGRTEGKLELRTYKVLPCPTSRGQTRFHLMSHTKAVYDYLATLGKIQEKELKKKFTKWYAENRLAIGAKQKDAWRFFQTHRPYLLDGGFLTILN